MSLLTDEEVKEIRLSIPAVCTHADLIRQTEKFIESKFSSLRAENEALKQQVEQGKRDAVPEDIRKDAERYRLLRDSSIPMPDGMRSISAVLARDAFAED